MAKSIGSLASSETERVRQGRPIKTGTRRSEHGFDLATPETTLPRVEKRTGQALVRSRSDQEVVRVQAGLDQSVRLALDGRLREKLNSEFDITGYEIDGVVTADQLQDALAAVETALQPLGDEELVMELTNCLALCVPRRDDQGSIDLATAALLDRLVQYPADIVRHVLEVHPRMSKWFPAWSELYEMIEWRWRRRALAREAILERMAEV